ncbi:MAG: PAS domain-containing protein, partial [Deltaproteobacteria bacterium]|nr:PAS domain-containing protein [Deltaproteobacteria bacterium]
PLQKRVVSIFHYALKDVGFLILGSSETVGTFSDLFSLKDKKEKIYLKKLMPGRSHYDFPTRRLPTAEPFDFKEKVEIPHDLDNLSEIRSLAERILIGKYTPSGVIVNCDLEVIHTFGEIGPYLTLQPGVPSLSLLKMAREGLSLDLRSVIHKAKKEEKLARREGIRVKVNGTHKEICVEVVPLKFPKASGQYFLVLFNQVRLRPEQTGEEPQRKGKLQTGAKGAPRVSVLEEEVARLKESLKSAMENLDSTIEELEASNEELKSANEEIMSSNEELQSTNEELETSKEELQSSNEELNTVNDELQNRNAELTRFANDLTNVLGSIKIPLVLLGPDLRIRRFTPLAEKLLKLIATDVGRPITDIKSNITISHLAQKIGAVIDKVAPYEEEVRDEDGHWYKMVIQPYRTTDNRIDGAVLSLHDIHLLKTARDYFDSVVQSVKVPLVVLSRNLRIITANRSFYDTFKVRWKDTQEALIYELGNGQWNIPPLRKLLEEILPKKHAFDDFEITHDFESIGQKTMLLNGRRINPQAAGMEEMILLVIEDISERKKAGAARTQMIDDLSVANRELEQFAYIASHDLQEPLRNISTHMELLVKLYGSRLDEKAKEFMDVAITGAKRMKGLVEDLLTFSRTGREAVQWESVDCSALFSDLMKNLKPLIEESRAEIIFDNLPTIEADGALLRQVFQNFVSNAIKFHGDDPPKIHISARQKDKMWEFRVEDNGIGIDEEYKDKIFLIFQRLHSRESYPGSGIGLAICKKIVERHGGRIWVESQVGKGSVFFFVIPTRGK